MILKDNSKVKLPDEVNDDFEAVIEVEDDAEEVVIENKKDNYVEEESNYESNQPFFKNKWVRYGLIVGAILILIIIFVLIISSCSSSRLKGFDMTKIPVLYVDEEFDFKIVPTNDIEKSIKYKFKMVDENIAYVKYPSLKGKSVKNTIVPKMVGETVMKTKAGKVDSTSKVIVCNRLNPKLADNEHGVKLNKTSDLDLGLGENEECYENLKFEVSDKSIIDLDGISVTGKKAGSTTLTVSDGKVDVKIKIKVSTKSVYVTSLVAKDNDVSLKVGEAKQLNVEVRPSDATNKDIKWSSNNEDVVTVNDKGIITGKKSGIASIKAEAFDGSGKSISIKVNVTKPSSGTSGSNGSSTSKPSSNPGTKKTTYYQYRSKVVTPVTTQMCNYYNARYVTGTYYTVGSFMAGETSSSNQLGVVLESSNAKEIRVSAASGKEYVNFSTYCKQKRNGTIFWPKDPKPVSDCNHWTFDSKYAAPKAYISSVSVNNISKSSAKTNGYQFNYNIRYSSNAPQINGRGTIATRFTVSYYAVATKISTASCSALNSAQAKFVVSRYNNTKNVVSYSDYKWTSNPNLANAEYTGKTKVE